MGSSSHLGPYSPTSGLPKIRSVNGELWCTDYHGPLTREGQLAASSTTVNWCEHINKFINANQDSQDLFEDFQVLSEQNIGVPIFPSFDRFTVMKLHSPVSGPAYAVDWQGESLGYINQGEGRASLRLMLLDHLMDRMGKAECHYPSHGYKEQMAWEQAESLANSYKPEARKARALSLAQRFAVIVDGACLECLKDIEDDFSADDLVPDVPGTRRGFPKGATGSRR